MIPLKIEKWLSRHYFPQRVLLSGTQNTWDQILLIASRLQQTDVSKIANHTHFDTLVLNDNGEKIKIGTLDSPDKLTIRGLKNWANQKPVAPYRLVLIENFERTTRDAMQTCLKILEEPPAKTIFLFSTKNHHQLPETILSRMTLIRNTQNSEEILTSDEAKLFIKSTNLIEKFGIIETLAKDAKDQKNKKIITNFSEDLLNIARTTPQYQSKLELIHESHNSLMRNINAKLTLERLALHLL